MIFPSSSMNYYGAFALSWISPSKVFKNLQINVDLCMYTVIWIITLLIFSFDIGDVFSVQNVMDNDWLWVVAQKDNKSGLVPYALMEELVSRLHQLNESDFTLLFIIPNFVFIPSAVFAHEITAMHSGKVSNDWEASNKACRSFIRDFICNVLFHLLSRRFHWVYKLKVCVSGGKKC